MVQNTSEANDEEEIDKIPDDPMMRSSYIFASNIREGRVAAQCTGVTHIDERDIMTEITYSNGRWTVTYNVQNDAETEEFETGEAAFDRFCELLV